MAHRVDDLNYTTVSGQRRFKDSPIPGTTFSANMANMFQEEMVRTVEAAGLTPAASAAADQAAGWSQLILAIRRLAWKGTAPVTHTLFTAGEFIDPNFDNLQYFVAESSALGTIDTYLGWDPYYDNMMIVLVNTTPSRKRFLNVDDSVSCELDPGQGVLLIGKDNGSSVTIWRPLSPSVASLISAAVNPINAKFTQGTTTSNLIGGTSAANVGGSTNTAYWRIVDKQLFITATQMGCPALASNEAYLKYVPGPNVSIPPLEASTNGLYQLLELKIGAGAFEVGVARLMDDGEVRIYRFDRSDFPSGSTVFIHAFSLHCALP